MNKLYCQVSKISHISYPEQWMVYTGSSWCGIT